MKPFPDIDINDYDYPLPEERIARYPKENRDQSQLLLRNRDGSYDHDVFKNLSAYIEESSCMVFNNSRVIPARLIFQLPTGSSVEIFCLRPVDPDDYQTAMQSTGQCSWQCLIGNKRRFKKHALETKVAVKDTETLFRAEKKIFTEKEVEIHFVWDNDKLSFADILTQIGRTPLPPYIKRLDEISDKNRYQTIYSKIDGSVAAPTAGLHFTDYVLKELGNKKVQTTDVTLHVGAGTFLPVKTADATKHDMHAEYFQVSSDCIEKMLNAKGPIVAVGTTSARTLESLYWLGVKLLNDKNTSGTGTLSLQQWEAYQLPRQISRNQSFEHLLTYMQHHHLQEISAYTKLMIVPRYSFKVVDTLLTNFHQPKSTLLLMLAAFAGDSWREAYTYAMNHGFRFLSYGDSSLFCKNES